MTTVETGSHEDQSRGTDQDRYLTETKMALAEELLSVLLTARAAQVERLERLSAHMAEIGYDWTLPARAPLHVQA